MLTELSPESQQIVQNLRRFVDREVIPVASKMEHDNEYPFTLVEQMKEMGLFGILIPREYGGLGLDYVTYAAITEELSRGWMSLGGIINSHYVVAHAINEFGTADQKQRFLPDMAAGQRRACICMTEPNAGSDLQAIELAATRDGDRYLLNGTKMFVTNGRHGNLYLVLAKTDKAAKPPYRGMSTFVVEKGVPGFTIGRDVEKLGYKGVDTVVLHFEDAQVEARNLLEGVEGRGFGHVMSGIEVGRINTAARAVGLAQAAFEDAIRYAQQRHAFGVPIAQHQAIQFKLADMATQIEAARLLTYQAAAVKDRGVRSDKEAGMAKLFATEVAGFVSLEAMRIHGGYGYTKDMRVERYYRDAPFMMIAEGTNEVQRLVIARALLREYAEGAGS
ncbi:MAG: acyl-CoA dehydrogenase family protein [Chloroflexi bacterium]|nr:acyl-CoA dehydrogenase family protein [Chloroflexota bacterium]